MATRNLISKYKHGHFVINIYHVPRCVNLANKITTVHLLVNYMFNFRCNLNHQGSSLCLSRLGHP